MRSNEPKLATHRLYSNDTQREISSPQASGLDSRQPGRPAVIVRESSLRTNPNWEDRGNLDNSAAFSALGRRPRLLDLFSGAGGAAVGYHRAGFEVVGVDIKPQPRFPFEFHQADALTFPLDGFDAIHASPPCQAHSVMKNATGVAHADLIPPTRELLASFNGPTVIENTEFAPLRDSLKLCGTMFGVRVRRHRLFEVRPSLAVLLPPCCCHNGVIRGELIGHRQGGRVAMGRTKPPHHTPSEARAAIGVEWMTTTEARQAIPPAYTEYIGAALMRAILERAA